MYIYSKWSDKDMLCLSAMNGVADLFELLGIYSSFCHDLSHQDFDEYYRANVGKRPFHHRNLGEKVVKSNLLSQGIDIPRKDFRLLFRTYTGLPVITSSYMGKIFSELTNQIFKYKVTADVLGEMKVHPTPQDMLYFQYYFVSRYVRVKGYASSFRKLPYFKSVLSEWENNTIFSV